jgi:putative ABC transport system permease protein
VSTSGARAALRIARRGVGRNRWRNALVVLLVALPVAAMSAMMTFFATTTPSPDARATDYMGRADLIVSANGSATTAELERRLPAGSTVEAFAWLDERLAIPGRQLRVQALAADPEKLSAGRVTLLAGRYPIASNEAAVTRRVVDATGLQIGDRLELTLVGGKDLVGIIEVPLALNARRVLLHASLADDPRWADARSWLVDLPPGIEMPAEPALPYAVEASLQPRFSANPRSTWRGYSAPAKVGTFLFGALALAGTVLVAASAFAVSIRRRQRELGMLAAVGASRRQLVGVLAAEGALVGLVGAAAGVGTGVGIVVLLSPLLDELTNRRNPPLHLDPVALLLAAGLGIAAAAVAAAIPGWSAARLPVMLALSGRRPPHRSAGRILVLGVVLIGIGAVMTAYGAAQLLASPASDGAFIVLAGGAVVGILGFGATSPWLIERLEWLGRRLPLSPRIALRDASRARSRSAPIVTAMLAALATTIAAAAFLASYNDFLQTQWRPWARADQLFIQGSEAGFVGPDVALQLGAVAGAPVMTVNTWVSVVYRADGSVPGYDPDEPECADCLWAGDQVAVGDVGLLRALGAESAAAALSAGRVVILTDRDIAVGEALLLSDEPNGLTRSRSIPVAVVDVGLAPPHALPDTVVPPALARDLGLATEPFASEYVIRLGRPVTESDLERADAMLAEFTDTTASAPLGPTRAEDGPRWAITIASFLFALSVAAIAVALGEAEARNDQRTLLAVGADPRIRRRIVASRAAVLGLLAALLALPAGLIPVWGLLASRDTPLVVPVLELVLVVVALPAMAAVGGLLLSRPIPQWSAFREVSQ